MKVYSLFIYLLLLTDSLTQNFTNQELLALKQQALQQQQQKHQRLNGHFHHQPKLTNNNNGHRDRLPSADYIYGSGGRTLSKSNNTMTPIPHSRSVSTSDFYDLQQQQQQPLPTPTTQLHHISNNNEDDGDLTEKHINKNILIEPMMTSQQHVTSSFLHPTPSRSRSPSPSVSDGDSGYSSKQMSPVSLVSISCVFNLSLSQGRVAS